jgi:hypothetical protein
MGHKATYAQKRVRLNALSEGFPMLCEIISHVQDGGLQQP